MTTSKKKDALPDEPGGRKNSHHEHSPAAQHLRGLRELLERSNHKSREELRTDVDTLSDEVVQGFGEVLSAVFGKQVAGPGQDQGDENHLCPCHGAPRPCSECRDSFTAAEYCKCGESEQDLHAQRKQEAEEQLARGCGECGKPHRHLPIPAGPLAPPLMRLVKSGPGVIGYPWVEVVSIANGDPYDFYKTTRYLCRLPGEKAYIYKWFSHVDLYGDGGDYGEYDAE